MSEIAQDLASFSPPLKKNLFADKVRFATVARKICSNLICEAVIKLAFI